jgi:hypothetical protein
MKRWCLIAFLAAAACGDASAPELSEITLSQTAIQYGDEFFASFEATDPDGDLDGSQIEIRFFGPEVEADEEVDLETTVDVLEVLAGQTEVSMAVALTLTGQYPLGVYALEIRVTDGGGNESEPAETRILLIPQGGRIIAPN